MDQRSKSAAPFKSSADKNGASQSKNNENQNSSQTGFNQANSTMRRSLHDLEAYKKKKMEESAPFFKSARVQTCSHVVMRNGKAIAVAFPLEKTGWKNPNSYQNTSKSSEVQSWARTTFRQRENYHAGMLKKPLEPYHPNAFRSCLPQPTVVMPYKNSSQIVIGDRSSDDRRQFRTVNQLMQLRPNLDNAVSNGGILAAQTKWIHYQQNKIKTQRLILFKDQFYHNIQLNFYKVIQIPESSTSDVQNTCLGLESRDQLPTTIPSSTASTNEQCPIVALGSPFSVSGTLQGFPYCMHDYECQNGCCYKGYCYTYSTSECEESTDRDIGNYCTMGYQCKSGCCDVYQCKDRLECSSFETRYIYFIVAALIVAFALLWTCVFCIRRNITKRRERRLRKVNHLLRHARNMQEQSSPLVFAPDPASNQYVQQSQRVIPYVHAPEFHRQQSYPGAVQHPQQPQPQLYYSPHQYPAPPQLQHQQQQYYTSPYPQIPVYHPDQLQQQQHQNLQKVYSFQNQQMNTITGSNNNEQPPNNEAPNISPQEDNVSSNHRYLTPKEFKGGMS